jgi:predicted lipoprotein with Yx(FWY)xxD motif
MRRFMALMCVPAIIVVLAACGSSSSSKAKAKTSSTSATTPKTTPATGAQTVSVKVATSTTGKILVDNAGKTLYTLTSGGQPVACSDACAQAWPPLLLEAGTSEPTGGPGVTGLGVAVASSGGLQVTHDKVRVYRFSGDTNAGDTKGEGIISFGGTWHLVKATGSSSATTSTPTTSGGSSGY